MSELYTRIEKLCEENNTNVTELCRELKMPRSPLSELKAGRSRTLSSDKLVLIADYFGVSVDWLTGKSGFKNNTELAKYYEGWGVNDIYFDAPFDFCDLLAGIREEQSVSVSEMAEVIGVTPQEYSDCEDGVSPITHEQAEKLCEYLGTNTSQVFFDNGYYDGEVPEAYHNDVRKWELLKRQDELDRIVSSKYPDFVKGKNYLPSGKCMEVSDYKMLEKYHALDPHGTKIVDFVLNEEYERCVAEQVTYKDNTVTVATAARNGGKPTIETITQEQYEALKKAKPRTY